MPITCFIRYETDPFKLDLFKQYAEAWAEIIPRCGGYLIGYFLPHEGSNVEAWGLIAFANLAAYEAYRARLRADPQGQANFAFAMRERFSVGGSLARAAWGAFLKEIQHIGARLAA